MVVERGLSGEAIEGIGIGQEQQKERPEKKENGVDIKGKQKKSGY